MSSSFHNGRMNSGLKLINLRRFHVLIPKVKEVIVLANEVSVGLNREIRERWKNMQLKAAAEWIYKAGVMLKDKGKVQGPALGTTGNCC